MEVCNPVSSEYSGCEEREGFQNHMGNLQNAEKELLESTPLDDKLFESGAMSANENISVCLEEKQQVQIDVMAKRKVKINIRFIIEEMLKDEISDYREEIMHINNDLVCCDMRKFTQEMIAGDAVKREGTDETFTNPNQKSDIKENDFGQNDSIAEENQKKKRKTFSVRLESDENSKPDIHSDDSFAIVKRKGTYNCEQCKKDFSYFKTFQKHMNTHKSKENSQNKLSEKIKEETDSLETENSTIQSSRRTRAKKQNTPEDRHAKSNPVGDSVVNDSTSGSDSDCVDNTESNSEDEFVDFDSESSDPDTESESSNTKTLPDADMKHFKKSAEGKQNYDKETINDHEEMNEGNAKLHEHSRDSSKKTMKTPHSLRKTQTGVKLKKSRKKFKPAEDGLYHCTVCEKKYTVRKSLRMHMNIHQGVRPYQCEFCPKSFSWSGNLSGHIKMVHLNYRPHQCPVCGYCCSERCNLNKHMLIHTDRKPLVCKICGQEYFTKTALKNHLIVHSGVKSHKCSICEKEFYLKQQLKEHIRIHSDVHNFVCDVCGKQFRRFRQLKMHREEVHFNEKLFTCKTCGNTYTSQNKLKQHDLTHQKPVVCELCGKAFAVQSNLKAHMTMHTGAKPFTCEFCGKTFRWIAGYTRHKAIHLDVKKFACKICGKRFQIKREYNDHLNTHTGNRPYHCTLCTTVFSHYSSMRKHYKNVHNISMADLKQQEQGKNAGKEKAVTDILEDGNELDTVGLSQEMFMI